MKKEVAMYISHCSECQKVKAEHKHPAGLLHPLHIPEWKWDVVIIDFITKFPRTEKQRESIMVVVDKLTNSSHSVPIQLTFKATTIAKYYMK